MKSIKNNKNDNSDRNKNSKIDKNIIDNVSISSNNTIDKHISYEEIYNEENHASLEKINSSDMSDIESNKSYGDAFAYDKKKLLKEKKSNNGENDNIEKIVHQEYLENVVVDRIINYIKMDDIIKQKKKAFSDEMKAIKKSKEQLEKYLISYLDDINEDTINIGKKATLNKVEKQIVGKITKENVTETLLEGFKKYNIYDNEADTIRVITDFMDTIESKREIKTKKYLERKTPEEINKKENKQSNSKTNLKKINK